MGLLLEDCGLESAEAPLTLNNVSALYRRAALAKALKLKVGDFLSLKALSGHDPFASPEDTAHFGETAATLASSGLKPGQWSYILRHVSTGSGPGDAEPAAAAVTALARGLREGLTAIAQGNGIAPDPNGTLTAQKLALLYDGGVVGDVVGMINGTVNYSAPLVLLPAGTVFPPPLAKKITFDPVAQYLYCLSPLTSSDRASLLALSNDPAFQSAVNFLYQQPLDLVQSVLGSFLDTKEAQKKLVTDAASLGADLNPVQLDSQGNSTADPTKAQSTAIAAKFAYVLQGLLPYLTVTLGGSLVKKTVSDSLKISTLMAQKLLDGLLKSRLDGTRTAAFDFLSLQTPGLSAAYYPSPDLTGPSTPGPNGAVAFDGDKTPLPNGTLSASWTGMVASPGSGDFELIIRTNGKPSLWVDDLSTPLELVPSAEPWEWISVKTALKAAQLYNLRLDVNLLPPQKAGAALLWQSQAVRKSVIPAASLYPSSILEAFRETYILLQKTSIVSNALQLTEDELGFLTQKGRGLPELNPNAFPAARNPTLSNAIDLKAPGLFAGLLRAARFAAFRKGLPFGDIPLTLLFTASQPAAPAKDPAPAPGADPGGKVGLSHPAVDPFDRALDILAAVTGWDPGLVRDLAGPEGFALSLPDFRNEDWPLRLGNCVQLSQRLGVSPQSLFQWSAVSPDYLTLEKTGQDVKKCVQAQYDEESWLTIAKPLNDKLRDAQRNALVAYLLPRMGLADRDQMFEYFLIDADMGVCTETSRISLAHSTVQLFVQRCLMGLEESGDIDGVSPHQIDSDQWEKWRMHYRVWQANCQVLLHPENWMQQSLRDDKTPFFTALEGELPRGKSPPTTSRRPT